MTDFVFNAAKGRAAYLAGLPAANDALIAVVVEAAGVETLATLRDYTDLAALLAGSCNEQTAMARKTLTGVTVTTDPVNDWVTVDCDDLVWASATGNPTGLLVICYDADTGSGTDANLTPLVGLDFVATPNGGDLTYVVASGGFYRAQ